jgi:hypothetical protein
MINNSREIIRNAVRRAEKPINKYNEGLQRSTEDYGVIAADYRGGYDTGNYPERHNFD